MEKANIMQAATELGEIYQKIINLIPQEKCDEILECIYEKVENTKDLSLETDREKSFIFWKHYQSFAQKMPTKYSVIDQTFQNIDFDTIAFDTMMDKDDILGRIFGGNGDSIKCIEEKPYYDLFLQMLSTEERNVWMSNKECSNIGNILSISNNKKLYEKIVYFFTNEMRNQRIAEEQKHADDNLIKCMKASRKIRSYKYEYKLVKSLCSNVIVQFSMLIELYGINQSLNQRYMELILAFYYYCLLYDDDFKDAIWVLFDELIIPLQRGRLWNFMLTIDENDPYIECFCLGLHGYYNCKGKTLPFDFSVLPFWHTPEKDKDEEHKDWFLEISQDHYDGDDLCLVQNLGKLYKKLVEEKYIEERRPKDESIFIYRLSGYNCPIDESTEHVKLLWSGKTIVLGYLVRFLYQNKYKQDPPFKRIVEKVFDFKVENPNLSSAIISDNVTHSTQIIVEKMLKDCGFQALWNFMDGFEPKKTKK